MKTESGNISLGDCFGYGWAICGLALTQHVTPMTAKKPDEPKQKTETKKKSIPRMPDYED